MASKANSKGDYVVTGPGSTDKTIPVFGAALAYAQHKAADLPAEGTVYVRLDGNVVAYTERLSSGVVVSRIREHDEHGEIEKAVVTPLALDEAVEEAA